ncbi:MAG: rhomboid family intramembrane serine protease [Planctomycetota bacterium]
MATPAPEQNPPPRLRPTPRVYAYLGLAAACVVAYVALWLYGGSLSPRGLLSQPALTLISCGAKDRQLIVEAGEWWRLLSCGFLHANAAHLVLNVYALVVLGGIVERLWGTQRFLIVYVLALVSGSLLSLAATPGASVGASGAVFGLFGAVVVFSIVHRHLMARRGRVKLWVSLGVVAAINVGLGIALPAIDNAAHAGGFAGGALAALVLQPAAVRRESFLSEAVVRGVSVAAVVAMAWGVASAVHFAAAPATVHIARSEMERRTLKGGAFHLYVPARWEYEPPAGRLDPHVFQRRGVARIAIRILPRRDSGAIETVADAEAQALGGLDVTLLAERETLVRGHAALERQFRADTRGGAQRIRLVVFPTPLDRHVSVVCACPERQYRLLEVLFDKVIQSIEPRSEAVEAPDIRPPQADSSGARALWERVTRDPQDVEAYVPLAAFYRLEGRFDAAEQLLRTALRLRPGYPDAHDQIAYLYATAPPPHGDPAKAIEHAVKAIDQQPETARYHATLALAHEAAGDVARALAAARRAAALAPDDARYADLVKRLSKGASEP